MHIQSTHAANPRLLRGDSEAEPLRTPRRRSGARGGHIGAATQGRATCGHPAEGTGGPPPPAEGNVSISHPIPAEHAVFPRRKAREGRTGRAGTVRPHSRALHLTPVGIWGPEGQTRGPSGPGCPRKAAKSRQRRSCSVCDWGSQNSEY